MVTTEERARRTAKAKATRATNKALNKKRDAEYKLHCERMERRNLAWTAVAVRGLRWPEDVALVEAVEAGTQPLSAEDVAAEIEARLATVRCHAACVAQVRKYGRVDHPDADVTRCQVCWHPLLCGGVDRVHGYVEISVEEAHRRGVYHGGNCYHVSVCKHCDDLTARDSSD